MLFEKGEAGCIIPVSGEEWRMPADSSAKLLRVRKRERAAVRWGVSCVGWMEIGEWGLVTLLCFSHTGLHPVPGPRNNLPFRHLYSGFSLPWKISPSDLHGLCRSNLPSNPCLNATFSLRPPGHPLMAGPLAS